MPDKPRGLFVGRRGKAGDRIACQGVQQLESRWELHTIEADVRLLRVLSWTVYAMPSGVGMETAAFLCSVKRAWCNI